MTPLPGPIADLINAAAGRHGIAAELGRAVAWVESNGLANVISPAGAMGVMQLMPATAASLGVVDPLDPATNIDGGIRFLSSLLQQFAGDVPTALAAYNWGPGNVRSGRPLPSSVLAYIRRVLSRMALELGSSRPSSSSSSSTRSSSGWGAVLAILGVLAFVGALVRANRSLTN